MTVKGVDHQDHKLSKLPRFPECCSRTYSDSSHLTAVSCITKAFKESINVNSMPLPKLKTKLKKAFILKIGNVGYSCMHCHESNGCLIKRNNKKHAEMDLNEAARHLASNTCKYRSDVRTGNVYIFEIEADGTVMASAGFVKNGGLFDYEQFDEITGQNNKTNEKIKEDEKEGAPSSSTLLAPVTVPDTANRLVENAWNPKLPQEEQLVEGFSMEILRKDLRKLEGPRWLNDNIINFYLQLICHRSLQNPEYPKTFALNTYFYGNLTEKGYASVRRWTKKTDLFSYDLILVPVHKLDHWSLAVVDLAKKKIDLFDSKYDRDMEVLRTLKEYIVEEYEHKKMKQFDFTAWEFRQITERPRQSDDNNSDCGVFLCQYAQCISLRKTPLFSEEDMPNLRKLMVYQILKKNLCSEESTLAGALSPRRDTREVTNAYDEMIATEISYVADLKEVIIHYLEPFEAVENQNSLPEALRGKPDCLFGNIRELYKFHHRVVLEDLVAARSTAEMCRVFMQHRNQIYITYRTYCQIHGSNQKVRDSVKSHPFFKDCQRKANHNMDMSSYLLKPIQRIMKYQLLLGNIMDDCPVDVRDEIAMTRDSMVELLNQIDASMQQLHISGYNGDLKSLGLLRLQTECDVYTYNRKKKAELSRAQKRFIFFFDGAVMFCKKRVSNPGTGLNSEPEYFEHKFCIPMTSLGHEVASRTGEGRFEVWDKAKTDAYVIETIDPSARTKWIQRLGKSDTSQDTWLDQK
ncbi:unnamed protein product [Caenorhabditis brenneri]